MTQQEPPDSAAAAGEEPDSLRHRPTQSGHCLPSPATSPGADSSEDTASHPAHSAKAPRHAERPSRRRRPARTRSSNQQNRPIQRILTVLLLAILLAPPLPVTHAQADVTSHVVSDRLLQPFFVFDKSAEQLRLYSTHDLSWMGYGITRFRSTTRSDSGMTRNDCDKHDPPTTDIGGWLPNGRYDIEDHKHNYAGPAIVGIAWKVSNKACNQWGGSHDVGTDRTGLYIHTTRPGPDHTYLSDGCIKVDRPDIRRLNSLFDTALMTSNTLSRGLRVQI